MGWGVPNPLVQVDLVGFGRGPGQVVAWGLARVQAGGVPGSMGAGPGPGAGEAGVAIPDRARRPGLTRGEGCLLWAVVLRGRGRVGLEVA